MNAVKRLVLGGAWIMLTVGASGHAQTPRVAASGPSFSCAAASTATEKTICHDPALAAADRETASLFALARQSAFGTGPSNELAAQRKFLQETRACGSAAAGRSIPECLTASYGRRNGELAVAVLMRAPDKALPVLRRVAPEIAPLLEAVALWAGEPVNANWSAPYRKAARTRITALLTPYFNGLRTDESQSFGRSILSDRGADGIAVTRLEDIFSSDRHFAALLNVLGPYLPEGNDSIRAVLPCAAIVRHPALLHATGPAFGSTMDGFVLNSDCERTLPPLPALDALDDRINRTWPECDGTIRFSAYRSYRNAVDAARLGQMPETADGGFEMPGGIAPADVTKVRSELERHYAAYLAKSPAEAAKMAREAAGEVLSAAHSCGT
ncbi:lysozyme inhibitor LprI family protein [Novosphingobium sp.]|jgi:hypothetical protein|uniref:lysozyme inhibitor LprI family protein n=1 Tax=Novosphingobium sp. TaxID=1874826 RepID=UPI002FE21551